MRKTFLAVVTLAGLLMLAGVVVCRRRGSGDKITVSAAPAVCPRIKAMSTTR